MPLEQAPAKPAPWPPVPQNDPKGRVPEAYAVVNDPNESFWSIARKTGVDATELLRYNFLTTKPEEINWYLKNYVGCQKPTSDGKNYQFAGALYQPTQNKGVIFIPRAAGAVVPVPVPGPAPVVPALPPGLQMVESDQFQPGPMGMYEQSFSLDGPTLNGGWLVAKVSFSGKVKFGPDSKNKAMTTIQNGKLKDVGGEVLVADLNGFLIKASFKWKMEDCARSLFAQNNRKKLREKLGEALELTFASSKIQLSEHLALDFALGASISKTPFNAKGGFKFFAMDNVGPALGFADPLVVGSEFSGNISIKFGPGPLMMQAARQAAASAGRGLLAAGEAAVPIAAPVFVIAIYAGFVGWGIQQTYAKGDRMVRDGWYADGYVTEVWGGPLGGIPPTDPENMRAIQAGRDDANRDAKANFPGGQAMANYKISWELATGCEPGSIDALFAGRRLLRDCVLARLRKDFPF